MMLLSVYFLRTHFLPLPAFDEVNDPFKRKIYMKSIRTNTWGANIFDPDTYAGTVSSPTIRLLLAIATEDDLDLVSHDIKSAFLYSSLKPEEKIFLKRPSGTSDDISPPVVQLVKCIYELPQAFKYFDYHLSSTLLLIGFTRCITGSEVFILKRDSEKVILVKHADDCLLAGSKDSSLIDFVSISLAKVYQSTKTVELNNFVGPDISRDRSNRSITINQPNYVATLIDRFLIPTSSDKYPMCEGYLTDISLHIDDNLLAPYLQIYFRRRWVPSCIWLLRLTRTSYIPRLSFPP